MSYDIKLRHRAIEYWKDGQIKLYYSYVNADSAGESAILTLKPNGKDYQFVSNEPLSQ